MDTTDEVEELRLVEITSDPERLAIAKRRFQELLLETITDHRCNLPNPQAIIERFETESRISFSDPRIQRVLAQCSLEFKLTPGEDDLLVSRWGLHH